MRPKYIVGIVNFIISKKAENNILLVRVDSSPAGRTRLKCFKEFSLYTE